MMQVKAPTGRQTGRKMRELHDWQNRLALIVDSSLDAIIGKNPVGIITQSNKASACWKKPFTRSTLAEDHRRGGQREGIELPHGPKPTMVFCWEGRR